MKTFPSTPSRLDERLATVDPQKLSAASGDASDSGPFYNCFLNRFTEAESAPTEELDKQAGAAH
jgi:hypothetical protein